MGRATLFVPITVLFVSLFVSGPTRAAAVDHIVISKIQTAGVSTKDEFIDLYNPTDAPVSLIGWRLSKQTASGTSSNLLTTFPDITLASHATLRIAHPDYAGSTPADATYTTQNSIAADNTVTLYGDAGITIIDRVGFGSATIYEGAATVNPTDGAQIERHFVNGAIVDTDNNAADFELSTTAPPETQPTPEPAPTLNGSPANTSGGSGMPIVDVGTVRINEFVSDPADNDVEWIELYNTRTTDVPIDGWTIEDGSGQATKLSGIISANGFFIVSQPKGQLNNSGDAITLKATSGNIVDAIAYGDWKNNKDNAPSANDPNAVARSKDGLSTGNDAVDFALTTTPTKGVSNTIGSPSATTPTETTATGLILNELFPNPLGSDEGEFVELLNTATKPIDVAGWELATADGQHYWIEQADFAATLLQPNTYFIIPKTISGLTMKNQGGDMVRLIAPGKTRASDTAPYSEDALENESYSLTSNGWLWSKNPTPGASNSVVQKDKPPVPILYVPREAALFEAVVLSAEDSFDPEREPLTYAWSLGDGSNATGEIVVYTFPHAGVFPITLTVSDDHDNQQKIERNIAIGTITTSTGRVAGAHASTTAVKINELLPNPNTNEDEWIELYNDSMVDVSLAGWSIEDASSKRFTFSSNATMPAFSYLVIPKTQTHIALNNDKDTLTLSTPEGDEADTVSYAKSFSGSSLARNTDSGWQWTSDPTPGSENTIEATANILTAGNLTVAGTVLAEPGTIGAHTLYLARIGASSGIEQLRVDLDPSIETSFERGDEFQMSGTLRTVASEPRLQVTDEAAISLIGHDETSIVPISYTADATKLGVLMSASGTVGKGNSNGFILELPQDETVRIIMPIGVTPKRPYAIGSSLTVNGILSTTSAGFRLLVRDANDLIPETPAPAATLTSSVPTTTAKPWSENYLMVSALGCLFIAGALAYRWWRSSPALPFDIIDEEETV
ncbi:MAG: lamin tail domain-containing protein [Patescibacteria group bacterium]|jgi:hypothetical protein